ncbi:shikimate kinase [Dehalogenimonas sp. 4OHTPN]|uniref:Shikimate kinase n=1 Tax=Dehalogenimonas sp. 4OHTPN TaxID=3166643 RepID=A0AAU8GDB8_9CHLR
MNRNIALIGFMGSGKSTAGQRLARRLGREFIELDQLIEQRAGKTIPEIFKEMGESGFRDLEEAVIEEVSRSAKNAVIALGGGAVLRPFNVERLKTSATLVYLETEVEVLQDRLARSRKRPLLDRPDRDRIIEELHEARRSLYETAAGITVRTGRRPFAAVINEIIEKLGIDESRNR